MVNERFIVGKRYRGKRQWVRRMMHRFADEVMAQLTGKRGVAEADRFSGAAGKKWKRNVCGGFRWLQLEEGDA